MGNTALLSEELSHKDPDRSTNVEESGSSSNYSAQIGLPPEEALSENGRPMLNQIELDVITGLVNGETHTEISKRLGLKLAAIRSYATAAYKKLEVDGKSGLRQVVANMQPIEHSEDVIDRFSFMESTVLTGLGFGLSLDEVANRLGKTPVAIKQYIDRIRRKIGANNIYELRIIAEAFQVKGAFHERQQLIFSNGYDRKLSNKYLKMAAEDHQLEVTYKKHSATVRERIEKRAIELLDKLNSRGIKLDDRRAFPISDYDAIKKLRDAKCISAEHAQTQTLDLPGLLAALMISSDECSDAMFDDDKAGVARRVLESIIAEKADQQRAERLSKVLGLVLTSLKADFAKEAQTTV